MTVRMADVARAAGVSAATVSNVLNRPEVVAGATRDRVRAAIERLGYVPSEPARSLRSGTARAIGLVVPDVANPFFSAVARGVSEAAVEEDHAVVLVDAREDEARELDGIERLLRQHVRGALLTPVDEASSGLTLLRRRGMPVTLLDRDVPSGEQCSVGVNHVRGGALGIDYLRRLGHRRVAWVKGPGRIPQVRERTVGVEQAARAGGVEILTIDIESMTTAAGAMAGERLAALEERPSAVFCANDLLALGVMRSLAAHGLVAGRDVSIVGYDDIDFCASASTPLTSIRQPADEIGRSALRLLLAEVEADADHLHQRVLYDPVLVERDSARTPD